MTQWNTKLGMLTILITEQCLDYSLFASSEFTDQCRHSDSHRFPGGVCAF